ncbi:exocyst complex component 1 isoform X2 [Falco biarmicus]|uniref:exocyst complex component 1 isoform X2 n=1 Tax=Falco cherrug TaxID=345164 RepID=UPI0024789915|nr:exocyst complex component 1 isoform X2 [Falco cherrug]XP_055654046.1 exocyst complex component 1 isoform X2 [Falco peregrinus]XP_056188201.1 exocyst complex component 1 isoform X2 [Falco biarmicus]
MTAIKHALQRDIFTPNDERLLSIVNVCKAGKKKRNCFLCATVTTERPVQVNVVKVKKSDKGDFYKRQTAWALRDLAVVDAKDAVKDNPEFDLHFDKVYKWVASSTVEKNTFISCIWKLNQRYLRKKIDFINVSSQLLEESVPSGENQSVAGGDEEAVDEYQELNAREEQDIEIMMEGCEYAISNAEAFAEKLSRELQVLDGANIQSIMASEKQVNILMKLLDEALKEVDQIELKLSSYEEMLQSVKEQMDQISESNHLIHLSNTNNVKLLSEIEFLVNHMDLAKGHIKALQEGDLTSSRGIEACTNAADALLQCMNVALRPGHDMLHAVKQQQQRFSDLREQFARRLASHLNSVFVQQLTQTLLRLYNRSHSLSVPGHDQSSTLAQHSVELTLPNHHPFHRDLLRYAKLMEWLKNTDYGKYEGLTKNYMDYLSRLYEREIKDFFEVAKIKMTGTTREGKKFGLHGSSGKLTGSTSSLNKLSVQSSGNRRSQSSSLLDMGNMSASDLDVADRTKFDKIFEQVLSELEPLCLAEQDFISKFFKLQQHQSISGTASEVEEMDGGALVRSYTSGVPQTISSEKDMIRQMMTKIFRCIEPELNNLIALGDKIDSFNSLYMLVKMSHHVWTAQNVDPASFLSTTLGNVLVTVKRNFDKCISNQMKQMDEVKISKKSKVGILPFVAEFEEFAALAESIFKNAERRGDLDKAYIKLIRAVFVSVEKVANESQKTPRDVVMMENFHHIFATLSRLKISCLEAEKKEAKQKYTDHLQSYVIYSLGQPLEKLNHFFEGVEARVAQGVREEEVSYQLAFNKQELRKVIKEYPGKEVKKGLDNLYKKVDKHLCEEENLLQVVWHSMQDEFIRQYKHFEGLIARCYPGSGITMEFTIQDILDYCSSIAQSH